MKRYNMILNYTCGAITSEMKESPNGEWVKYEDIEPDIYDNKYYFDTMQTSEKFRFDWYTSDEFNIKPEPKKVYQMGVKQVSHKIWVAMCDGKEVGKSFTAENENEAMNKVFDLFDMFGFVIGMLEIKREK